MLIHRCVASYCQHCHITASFCRYLPPMSPQHQGHRCLCHCHHYRCPTITAASTTFGQRHPLTTLDTNPSTAMVKHEVWCKLIKTSFMDTWADNVRLLGFSFKAHIQQSITFWSIFPFHKPERKIQPFPCWSNKISWLSRPQIFDINEIQWRLGGWTIVRDDTVYSTSFLL